MTGQELIDDLKTITDGFDELKDANARLRAALKPLRNERQRILQLLDRIETRTMGLVAAAAADNAKYEAEIAAMRNELDRLRTEKADALEFIADTWEDIDEMHVPWADDDGEMNDCPQDDTCECPRAVHLNRVMATQEAS